MLIIKWDIFVLIAIQINGNPKVQRGRVPQRCRRCAQATATTGYVAARVLVIGWFCWYVVPDFVKLLNVTWNLNVENWWRTKEEPFYGNCSVFNAFLCWILWFVIQMIEYLGIIILSMLVVVIICLAKENGVRVFFLILWQNIRKYFKRVAIFLKCYILGTYYQDPYPSNNDDEYQMAQQY